MHSFANRTKNDTLENWKREQTLWENKSDIERLSLSVLFPIVQTIVVGPFTFQHFVSVYHRGLFSFLVTVCIVILSLVIWEQTLPRMSFYFIFAGLWHLVTCLYTRRMIFMQLLLQGWYQDWFDRLIRHRQRENVISIILQLAKCKYADWGQDPGRWNGSGCIKKQINFVL